MERARRLYIASVSVMLLMEWFLVEWPVRCPFGSDAAVFASRLSVMTLAAGGALCFRCVGVKSYLLWVLFTLVVVVASSIWIDRKTRARPYFDSVLVLNPRWWLDFQREHQCCGLLPPGDAPVACAEQSHVCNLALSQLYAKCTTLVGFVFMIYILAVVFLSGLMLLRVSAH